MPKREDVNETEGKYCRYESNEHESHLWSKEETKYNDGADS